MANLLGVMGLLLSAIGAVICFTTATLTVQTTSTGMMQQYTSGLWMAISMYALGAALLVTGILGVTAIGMRRMKVFGALMTLYGILMLLSGWIMSSEPSLMVQGVAIWSIGMFIVGVSMIGEGVLMVKTKTMTQSI